MSIQNVNNVTFCLQLGELKDFIVKYEIPFLAAAAGTQNKMVLVFDSDQRGYAG